MQAEQREKGNEYDFFFIFVKKDWDAKTSLESIKVLCPKKYPVKEQFWVGCGKNEIQYAKRVE